VIVIREFRFESAHQLPRHPGKCRRLHGHGYRFRVVCEADVDPETGLAIDFGTIKDVVRSRVIDVLDHRYLNELLPIPSAEYVAAWIFDRLKDVLPVREIVLWETEACSVVHRGEALPGPRP
jgi:6-pyruvoyltetrahydropterin/6-carboxytetrahydropterin synthase